MFGPAKLKYFGYQGGGLLMRAVVKAVRLRSCRLRKNPPPPFFCADLQQLSLMACM